MVACRACVLIAAVSSLLLVGAQVSAQSLPGDLIVNGTFDVTTLTPWTTSYLSSTLTYDPTDVDDCAGTGSGLVTHNEGQSVTVWFNQCLENVSDAQLYDFGARVLFPTADPAGNAYVLVYWYPTPDCSGPFSSAASSPWLLGSAVAGTWTSTVASAVAPDSQTQSAQLRLSLRRGSPTSGTPVLAQFDDVYFVPSGLIWADGLERGDFCRWPSTQP